MKSEVKIGRREIDKREKILCHEKVGVTVDATQTDLVMRMRWRKVDVEGRSWSQT